MKTAQQTCDAIIQDLKSKDPEKGPESKRPRITLSDFTLKAFSGRTVIKESFKEKSH